MNPINYLLPIMCTTLVACGGSETPMDTTKPAPNFVRLPSAPAAGSSAAPGPTYSIFDEVGKSFDLYSGQIDTNTNGVSGPNRAETILTQAILNADSTDQVTLKAPSGNIFVLKLDAARTLLGSTTGKPFSEYYYITDDSSFSMRIKRFEDGGNQAILKNGAFDEVTSLRASFTYGWKTDLASVVPDPGTTTARFQGFGGSDFFLSSGQRAFGGNANIDVDFAAKTVSGTLFDTLGGNPQGGSNAGVGITAKVDVTNATLNDDASITANNGMSVIFTDTVNNVNSISVTSGEVLGQLSGVDAASIGGGFAGTMDADQTGLGTQSLGFSGVFRATRQ